MKKSLKMFSNGTAAVVEAQGNVRKASKEEVRDYLISLVPKKNKEGSPLSAVKFEEGYVYARYEDNKSLRKKIAQSSSPANQTEPVNSVDKADPSVKVPRNEKKSKPESYKPEDKSVMNPTKVRKEEYNKGGDGGADSHTDVVPRSKGNSGLKGHDKTKFADEVADDATSGKPDSYVQKWEKSEDPASAGSEENHAVASNDIKVKSGEEIYQKINIAKAEENDTPVEKIASTKVKSDIEDTENKLNEKIASLNSKLKEASEKTDELESKINRYKIREARQKAAIKLALAYRDINPKKYANVEDFGNKVEDIAKRMNVEAIETALEELKTMHSEAFSSEQMKKEASRKPANQDSNDGGLSTVLASLSESYSDSNNSTDFNELSKAIMENTQLGKKMADFENYTPHEPGQK